MTPIATMPTGGAALFWGVVTFSILILLHEGGHFLAAQAFGVKVHEFMLGLPGPALTWRSKRSGIRYGITMVPLGGYVRIAGMEPGAEDPLLAAALGFVVGRDHTDAADLSGALGIDRDHASALLTTIEDYGAAESLAKRQVLTPLVSRLDGENDDALLARVRSSVYRGQRPWKRVTILSMGVLSNLVAAIVILTLTLTLWGVPTPVPTVARVAPGMPAAVAGMRVGDTITSVNGVSITEWSQITRIMRASHAGTRVTVGVRRDGQFVTFRPLLAARQGGGAMLGITADLTDVPMPMGEAVGASFAMTGQVFAAVGRLLNPATFAVSLQGARSIVGISYEVASAVTEGPLSYAWLIAVLSLSLGVMNVLPIPPLDGGKIASELVEALLRRPIPRKVSLAFSATGAVLLFSLIFYLMYADIVRYIVSPG
jgi:regulator of sigma E protease